MFWIDTLYVQSMLSFEFIIMIMKYIDIMFNQKRGVEWIRNIVG